MHLYAGVLIAQKRFQTLKMALQTVVSCLVWVLGTKLKSSATVAGVLHH